ncbi:hypothetical protein ACP4OV_028209 [Aristida adscensionis]
MASRDFLGGFGGEGRGGEQPAGGADEPSDEIELSLGLSLGGRFGADPAQDGDRPRLSRSTSVATFYGVGGGDAGAGEDAAGGMPAPEPLVRTSSLPTGAEFIRRHAEQGERRPRSSLTDEELRRLRAEQSERRQSCKRRRLERRNSMNSGRSPAGAATEAAHSTPFQPRRAITSQGSTSSAVPEQQGVTASDGRGSTATNTSSDSGQNSSLPPASPAGARPPANGGAREQPQLRSLESSNPGDLRRRMAEEMPMVSSRVSGPNVRRVDGFLYRYQKDEELRIVCVCHGSFLTPAEFVRHAGGGDVTNPLRHIVVQQRSSVFL